MIASLRGTLAGKNPGHIVVEANGVGYRLFITLNAYEKLPNEGENVFIHTVTIVREDAFHLYGFLSTGEKEIFLKLISVNRVGPKLACQVLSGISAENLESAVLGNDEARLSQVPGIGKKTAERIILDLKDKLSGSGIATPSSTDQKVADAVSALENLGYKKSMAEKAVRKIFGKNKEIKLPELIRESLKSLSPS